MDAFTRKCLSALLGWIELPLRWVWNLVTGEASGGSLIWLAGAVLVCLCGVLVDVLVRRANRRSLALAEDPGQGEMVEEAQPPYETGGEKLEESTPRDTPILASPQGERMNPSFTGTPNSPGVNPAYRPILPPVSAYAAPVPEQATLQYTPYAPPRQKAAVPGGSFAPAELHAIYDEDDRLPPEAPLPPVAEAAPRRRRGSFPHSTSPNDIREKYAPPVLPVQGGVQDIHRVEAADKEPVKEKSLSKMLQQAKEYVDHSISGEGAANASFKPSINREDAFWEPVYPDSPEGKEIL